MVGLRPDPFAPDEFVLAQGEPVYRVFTVWGSGAGIPGFSRGEDVNWLGPLRSDDMPQVAVEKSRARPKLRDPTR